MIKILRKHRNWLMIVIAVLALPFCLYFVKSDTSLIRSDTFVEMYGRKVTMSEARWDARLFGLSRVLGIAELHGLAPGSGSDDQKAASFIINLIVLRHEAERLGVSLPEGEIKSTYDQSYGKTFVSVVHVRANDLLKEVKVSDDDIKKYYESHKGELKSEEKRKVEFVRLGFTEEQKKLKDKERIDALQKLADS